MINIYFLPLTLADCYHFSCLFLSVSNILNLCFVAKDFVIEALRSIAELITYGDQHDSNFFEWDFSILNVPFEFVFYYQQFYTCLPLCRFFMEKQVMGEFVRILKISRTVTVSLQLLQTISIMIQNLKTEHAIC